MDAVDKQPASIAREQRAIDLRIEARLAFVSFGSIEQWFSLGRDGEARSEKIGDEPRRLASITIRAAALNFHGTPYEAVTTGEEAVALAERLADATWLGFAQFGLGQAYFIAGRYRDAELLVDQAIARLTSAPENVPPGTTASSLLVLCHMMKAVIYASIGEYDGAQESARRAIDFAEINDRPYDIVAADYGRGFVHMMHGDLEEAEIALEEAAFLSRENEVRLFLPLVLCALGNLHLQRGQAARARDILLEAKNEAETLGYATGVLLASVYLASAYAQLGDVSRGLEGARACQAGAKQTGYQAIEALAFFTEAGILSLQGAPAAVEAIARLERSIEISARLGMLPLLGLAKGVLARLLDASGRKSEARHELVQAIDLFDKSKMSVQLERAKIALSKFSDL
jgi:tetratricopeptide (TPR) repeat protein